MYEEGWRGRPEVSAQGRSSRAGTPQSGHGHPPDGDELSVVPPHDRRGAGADATYSVNFEVTKSTISPGSSREAWIKRSRTWERWMSGDRARMGVPLYVGSSVWRPRTEQ